MTQRTSLAAFRRPTALLAISLAIFACSDGNSNTKNDEIEGNSLLLNFTSDYKTGELRWLNPDSSSFSAGTLDFHPDSRLSTVGGNVFVLGNFPGTLACILPEKINTEKPLQEKLDAEMPYEVAVIGNKGYIAFNDEDSLQVFNINTCVLEGKIKLPISNANASSIKASGDTLLVILQRLDSYTPTKPGLLARINATTETLIDTVQLKFYNPAYSILNKEKLYIASPDNWLYLSFTNAGVEIVDLTKGTTEVLASSTNLDGGAQHIALDEANQVLYVSVYVAFGEAPVKPVNLVPKTVGNALPDIVDSFGGLVFDNATKKLFIGDRGFDNEGVKIYDPATGSITTATSTLPPYSLAIAKW